MIILFDLDDTLLENPMEKFLPAYLHLLGNHLSDFIAPEKLPEAILTGTELMINNTDPSKTLEDCFDEYFYPRLGKDKSDLTSSITDFYNNQFPSLKPVTGEIPFATETVNKIFDANHKLIIATNPLFPKLAIDHRVKWANLGIPLSQYEYITNYEELHFTKPRPEFITEILGKIGWPEETVVMVGNEWEMDILPAELIGLPTYFIGSI
ncbi:MAG TPA: HAD hydrolase-like protein, partial [Anaerolineaceae bacterium]|nr:HAD hydrolase-like protein [Anaerolineaceae bacterium]